MITLAQDTIASDSSDAMIKIWDVNSGMRLAWLSDCNVSRWTKTLLPLKDGRIASGYYDDNNVMIWNLKSGKCGCGEEKQNSAHSSPTTSDIEEEDVDDVLYQKYVKQLKFDESNRLTRWEKTENICSLLLMIFAVIAMAIASPSSSSNGSFFNFSEACED